MTNNGFKTFNKRKETVTIYSGDPPETIYFSTALIDKLDLQTKQPFGVEHNASTKEIRLTFVDDLTQPQTRLSGCSHKTKNGNDFLRLSLAGFFASIGLKLDKNLTVPVIVDGESITFNYEEKE